ncbi:hypothetical protein KJI95_12010 [Shewanella sp. JM162201]|uniref:EexN family lipoprotein n=1 Tax=Shewanella jiangmenensis TaxID=2837387 RepID=A0ABS5V6H7_9GAMM|nr:hypothetical protein [Shewanella jiangmenensis]MBT1445246.1 hypothetical protein [Shewanella jiangmenensis]
MKAPLLLLVVLLQGCSSAGWVDLPKSYEDERDGKASAAEIAVNVPRAVAGADPCKNGHPDDIAKCRAERQAETDALNESIRNRTQK